MEWYLPEPTLDGRASSFKIRISLLTRGQGDIFQVWYRIYLSHLTDSLSFLRIAMTRSKLKDLNMCLASLPIV